MKPAPFDYVAPTTIEEACTHLAEAGGGATLIAGGQTLMPLLALRMSQPFILVDLNRIPALKGASRADNVTRIGPMMRQNEVIAHPLLNSVLPMLIVATKHVGHHQTRNRGTIGGSTALGEPAAELPATAVALGASVEARSTRGSRRIAAEDLYLGPYATSLEPDELISDIYYPDWPLDSVSLFREVAQRPGDFALVGLTGGVSIEDGRIERAGLAWFGMGPTPMKARKVEAALIGKSIDARWIPEALADLAIADTAPFDDHHTTAEYRRTVGRRLFSRLIKERLLTRKAA